MFTLKSQAFGQQQEIPRMYSGEGENLSPPLSWSGAPPETKEFALICEDPDAPGKEPFVHWLLFHIPSHVSFLPEGISGEASLVEPFHANQGRNSEGGIGYTGPMPPVGHGRHRYFFQLFALVEHVQVRSAAKKRELMEAMDGKILATAELLGTYERQVTKKAA